MQQRPSAAERLTSKIEYDPNGGCWLWSGLTHPFGHGTIGVNGKNTLTHRFAWTLWRGEIPAGRHVLHKCDVPQCVNPDHLYLGSDKENARDRVERGRQVRGSRNGRSKLTEAQVLSIRSRIAAGEQQKDIAADVGLVPSAISRIHTRENWPHLISPSTPYFQTPFPSPRASPQPPQGCSGTWSPEAR